MNETRCSMCGMPLAAGAHVLEFHHEPLPPPDPLDRHTFLLEYDTSASYPRRGDLTLLHQGIIVAHYPVRDADAWNDAMSSIAL